VELQNNWNELVMNEPVAVEEARQSLLTSKDALLRIDVRIVDVLSNYAVPGVLVGFTPGEVAILTDEPMSSERTVAVHLSSFSFEGQTLYCGANVGKYELHVSIDDIGGAGLRKAPRFPVTIPAELMRADGDPIAVTIRDISRDGMGIESPVALDQGHPVAVASGPAFIFALVRYCKRMPDGTFRAGVEMHHLFERPPAAAASPEPNFFRDFWRRCISRKPEFRSDSKLVEASE
jgi:hypothetical protein